MRNPRSTPTASYRSANEDGAVLVLTALLLVVLIGFVALTVDFGALFVERRHAQNAADAGILSGAQFAGNDSNAAAARLEVAEEVIRITAQNLDDTDWVGCADTDRPAEFTFIAVQSDCISFTPGLTKIRVRVPLQTIDTYFAAVLGINTLSTTAAAEVELLSSRNGDILPFGVPAGEAAATLGCPSDHPNGLFPCDGPDSGNFNRLQMLQWGLFPPPDRDCTHSNAMFSENIARGVDHLLGIYNNPGNLGIDDKPTCEDPPALPPGTVMSNTGVAQSTLAPGLITGGTGFLGRLTDLTYSSSQETVLSQDLDNTPLWEYVGNYPSGSPSISGVPNSCQGDTFVSSAPRFDWDEDLWLTLGLDPVLDDPDYDVSDPIDSILEDPNSFEHMAHCLRQYRSSGATGVLFDRAGDVTSNQKDRGIYDLQLSPRWGWSPIGDFANGLAPFKIQDYKPVYINTLVANCNANTCNWFWHAGEDATSSSTQGNKISSMISFQLPESSVPESVIKLGPAAEFRSEYALSR
jgi:Flp pilus assembly protein TadG